MFLTGIAWGNRIDHIGRGPRPLILSLSIFSVISFLVSEHTAAYIYIYIYIFRGAITRLRNCWTAWVGGDSMAIIFMQIGAKGEQLEFGVCF